MFKRAHKILCYGSFDFATDSELNGEALGNFMAVTMKVRRRAI